MNNYKFFFFLIFFLNITEVKAINLEAGEKIFQTNCMVCHANGNNLIIPEKNLKKETLEINGMNTLTAISYQVSNGKNGMPAFSERLTENEIEEVSYYVLFQSFKNFEKN